MAMRASTARFILHLQTYACYRVLGGSPWRTVDAIVKGSDILDSQANELATAAGRDEAAAQKAVDKSASVIGAVAGACLAVPVVGEIASAVLAACAVAIKFLAAIFNVPADKYGFQGDKSLMRRACVGLNPPTIGITSKSDSMVNYFGFRGELLSKLHDGYLISPPTADKPNLVMAGTPYGVVARGKGAARNLWKYWRKHYGPVPPISDVEWDRRALPVNSILTWCSEKLGDRQLKMMDDILGDASGKGSSVTTRRMRGSIWYASLYMTITDLYDACKALGWEQAKVRLTALGAPAAGNVAAQYAKGLPQGEVVPGMSIAHEMNYDYLHAALVDLTNGLPDTAFKMYQPAAGTVTHSRFRPARRQAVGAGSAPQRMTVAPQTLTSGAALPTFTPVPAQVFQQLPDGTIAPAPPAAPAPAAPAPGAIVPMSTEKKLLIASGVTVASVGLLAWALKVKR